MTPLMSMLSLVSGCGTLSAESESMPAPEAEQQMQAKETLSTLGYEAADAPASRARRSVNSATRGGAGGVAGGVLGGTVAPNEAPADAEEDGFVDSARDEPPAETARTWFPEAFLWQPRVVTGDDGRATLDVAVPDQLTTWRVLALAHDREGQQAGTVHRFDTRLPVYVEPVVPGWLMAGDRLDLPVQVVNGTADPMTAALQVRATGALRGAGVASVRLSGGSSDVRYIPLRVQGAGAATVRAELRSNAARDAAQRVIPVQPAGRPVVRSFGSSLADARTFSLAAVPGADASTEELSVTVFPGALSVLQAEVERLVGGARPSRPAYAFQVASNLSALATQQGLEVDGEAQRRVQLLAWQRMVHDLRTLSPSLAAGTLRAIEGADLAMLDDVRPRLVSFLVDGQRADGTWSSESRSTLQRVLVQTAEAARALPEDRAGARLRAEGAVERYAREVDDAYTASVLLAAGLAQGPVQEHFRALLEAGLSEAPSGATTLSVPAGVVNGEGVHPTRSEGLAWAILALPQDHPARGDLASELMGRWSAVRGFGAGAADSVALEAVVASLAGAREPVQVVLAQGDVELGRGRVDPSQPREPVLITGKPRGDAPITVTATPEVSGLAFVATRRSWVPWTGREAGIDGVDVSVSMGRMVRGQVASLTIEAAAPSGTRVVIEQAVPAGAEVGAVVGADVIAMPGSVRVTMRPFEPGEVQTVEIPITPAFAGLFHTPATRVSVVGGEEAVLRPAVWRVASR